MSRKKIKLTVDIIEKLEWVDRAFNDYQNNFCINRDGCSGNIKLYVVFYTGQKVKLLSLCAVCAKRHPYKGVTYRKIEVKEIKDIFTIKIFHKI